MLNRQFAFLLFTLVVLVAVPVHAQYHIYWGDMHGHTAFSDGKGSLDDYFTHARDVAKLDFVVVSVRKCLCEGKECLTIVAEDASSLILGGKLLILCSLSIPYIPLVSRPGRFAVVVH